MAYRMYCTVLDEIRTCTKTGNYSYLLGLVEELQTIGNRMEAGLDAKRGTDYWIDKASEMKKEYKTLLEKVNKLRVEAGEEPHEECFW